MANIHVFGMKSRMKSYGEGVEGEAAARASQPSEHKKMMKEDNTTHDECFDLRPIWTPVGHRHVDQSRCSLWAVPRQGYFQAEEVCEGEVQGWYQYQP